MEKIKTPLGRIIHEKKKQVKSLEDQVEKLYQMSYVADRILECRNKIDMINNDIQFLESYLPAEREMIEKTFNQGYSNGYSNGICCDLDENTHTDKVSDSSVYFTQTFESYG